METSAKKTNATIQRTAVLELSGEFLTFGLLEANGEQTGLRWKRVPIENEGSGLQSRLNAAAITAALKTIVQEEKLSGANVHIVLSGDYCVTRIVAGSREQVQKELSDLRNRSSLYLSLGQGPKTFAESVLAIDAKRAQGAITVTNETWLSDLIHATKEASLKIRSVEHSLVALCRAVGKMEIDSESPVLLVQFNQRGIDLGVSHRGRLLLDYRPGGVGDHRQLAAVVLKHLGRIQRYCGRHFQFTSGKISRVVICGGGPAAEILREIFETEGKLTSEILDPTTVCPAWKLEKAGQEESWLVPIIGAVLTDAHAKTNDASPDLMEPIRLLQREPILPLLVKYGWPIAATILLTFGIYGVGLYQQHRLSLVETAANEAKEAEKSLTTQKLMLAKVESKIKYLNVINDTVSRPMWQDFLCDVSECLPEGTWLEDVKVDKEGTVYLSGPSYSEDSIYELIEKLKKVPNLANVALEGTRSARSQGGAVTMFDVRAAYNSQAVKTDSKKGA